MLSGSCFFKDRFTRDLCRVPERSFPQAETAELAAKISGYCSRFIEAFLTRLALKPHSSQRKILCDRARSVLTEEPQQEERLLEGNQRSASTSRAPYIAVLYVSCLRNSKNPASIMDRDNLWFFAIPLTFRFQYTTRASLASRVVALSVASLRILATR